MGQCRKGFNITDLHGWVGRSFQPQHARVGPDPRRHRFRVQCIHKRCFDTKAGQGVAREFGNAHIIGIRHEQVIALAQAPGNQGVAGGNAGTKGEG